MGSWFHHSNNSLESLNSRQPGHAQFAKQSCTFFLSNLTMKGLFMNSVSLASLFKKYLTRKRHKTVLSLGILSMNSM